MLASVVELRLDAVHISAYEGIFGVWTIKIVLKVLRKGSFYCIPY